MPFVRQKSLCAERRDRSIRFRISRYERPRVPILAPATAGLGCVDVVLFSAPLVEHRCTSCFVQVDLRRYDRLMRLEQVYRRYYLSVMPDKSLADGDPGQLAKPLVSLA